MKLDPSRIAGYRNFGTKLWNATRFADMNGAVLDPAFDPSAVKLTINRWILTELTRTADEVKAAIDSYKFNEASTALYRFVWTSSATGIWSCSSRCSMATTRVPRRNRGPARPMCWRNPLNCCIRSCRS